MANNKDTYRRLDGHCPDSFWQFTIILCRNFIDFWSLTVGHYWCISWGPRSNSLSQPHKQLQGIQNSFLRPHSSKTCICFLRNYFRGIPKETLDLHMWIYKIDDPKISISNAKWCWWKQSAFKLFKYGIQWICSQWKGFPFPFQGHFIWL